MKLSPATVLLAAFAIAPTPGRAADWQPIEIHGAVSGTAAYSDHFNYLGDTKDQWDLFSTELTVNGTHRFSNGLRFGAQVYAYKLDDYRDLTLDFASLDYSFAEYFGIRVGRSKQAVGIYGDTQDIDIIRPFALLPLAEYPKAMRSYAASYDGAAVYGSVPAGATGSIDYHLYGGWVPRYRSNDPWLMIMNDAAPVRVTEVNDAGRVVAGSVYWNTPVSGLKVGASASRTTGARMTGVVRSSSDLGMAAGDIRLVPFLMPPGTWDYLIAGHPGQTHVNRVTELAYSAEYTSGAWDFTAEYFVLMVNATSSYPVVGTQGYSTRGDGAYAMATWQVRPKLQLGAYYCADYADTHDRHGRAFITMPAHRAWTKEATVTACYSLASWWVVKAEAHFLDGTSVLSGRINTDAAYWPRYWNFLVLKSTISF